MVDPSIGPVVKHYLDTLIQKGLPVEFGVLFGSYAHGTPHRWSDIDVLVVSPRFDPKRQRRDIDLLWHTAARTDSRIEPIGVGLQQWQENHSMPILEIARQEGQLIWPNAHPGTGG